MKQLKDWFVPWLSTAREYNTGILDKAWANPDYGRLMLNENPLPPSEKVIRAVAEIMSKGNRYPDSMKRLRTKLGKLHNLGPGNIGLCNGSSEIIDSMMRIRFHCQQSSERESNARIPFTAGEGIGISPFNRWFIYLFLTPN